MPRRTKTTKDGTPKKRIRTAIKNRLAKKMQNKSITPLNKQLKRQLRTSFIFYVIKHIVLFPYYLAKLYLYLMYNHFRQWVVLNIIGCVCFNKDQ